MDDSQQLFGTRLVYSCVGDHVEEVRPTVLEPCSGFMEGLERTSGGLFHSSFVQSTTQAGHTLSILVKVL